jgi:hypothetical protein
MALSKFTPFSVLADYDNTPPSSLGDPDPAIGFRLYIDSAQALEQTAPGATTGTVSFSVIAGLPKGSHIVAVSAFNADGETMSAPLSINVTGRPPKGPINVRLA